MSCSTALAVLLFAAGCGENRAPAMTHASQVTPAEHQAAESPESADDNQRKSPPATDRDPSLPKANPKPERTCDISFDDLKFDIKKGDPFERSMLGDKIEALDGKPVRIRGYILPSFQQTGLTQFVLVRDNLSCCFGPGAAIYDCVIVEMKPGKSTDYSLYPVAVEGSFAVREMLDPDGKAVAVYHLEGEQVR